MAICKLPGRTDHAINVFIVFVSGRVFIKPVVLADRALFARVHSGQRVLGSTNSSGGANGTGPGVVVVPATSVAGDAILQFAVSFGVIVIVIVKNVSADWAAFAIVGGDHRRFIEVKPRSTAFARDTAVAAVA